MNRQIRFGYREKFISIESRIGSTFQAQQYSEMRLNVLFFYRTKRLDDLNFSLNSNFTQNWC